MNKLVLCGNSAWNEISQEYDKPGFCDYFKPEYSSMEYMAYSVCKSLGTPLRFPKNTVVR